MQLPATYASIKRIAEEYTAQKLYWACSTARPRPRVYCDATTACAIVAVYDAVNEENKLKLEAMIRKGPHMLPRIAAIAWGK